MTVITGRVKACISKMTYPPAPPLTVTEITHKFECDVHSVNNHLEGSEQWVPLTGGILTAGKEAGAQMAAVRSAAPEEALVDSESATTKSPLDLTNKSVIKATQLLKKLGHHRHGITVTELAQACEMTRPTAFRLLLSLEQTGFVERVDNHYMLGWQVARLGRLADPYAGAALLRYSPSWTNTQPVSMRRSASSWCAAEGTTR